MCEEPDLDPVYFGIMSAWGPTGLTEKQISDLVKMVGHVVSEAFRKGGASRGGRALIGRTLGPKDEEETDGE